MGNKPAQFAIAVFAIFGSPLAQAQTAFGTVVGAVSDASGASVPEAQVTLTNLGTSAKRNTVSGADGLYQFPGVTPGTYRIEIEKQGFKRAGREPVTLEVAATTRIDFALDVGETSQSVLVTAETPLLQPETSSLGQVVENRLTNELPLNGRNPLNLVGLVPSVVPQGQSMGTATGANPHAFGNYSIGGGISQQNATFLDGAPLNTAYINDTMLIPTQDSLLEFKVETNNLSAEYGKFAGGVINMSTKGGSNDLHGGAWEFLRNKVLNSSDFFSNLAGLHRPPFTQNEFGVNLGGPVYLPRVYNGRNKTFFFFNYEGFRLRQGQTFTNTNPTAAERTGDFSNLRSANGSVIPIYDPLTTVANGNTYTRSPFPQNQIPASRIALPSSLLLALYPLPNVPGVPFTNTNNWIGNAPVGGNNDQFVTRFDQNISDKQHLLARYSYWTNNNLPIDPFGTGVCKDRCAEKFNTNTFVVDDVYVLSPTTTLDLRGSFLRWAYNRTPKVTGVDVTKYGWPAALQQEISFHVLPMPTISGFDQSGFFSGDGGSSQIFSYDDNERIAGALTKVLGVHSLKVGGEFLRQTHNYGQDNDGAGNYSFDTGFTSSSPLNPTGGSGLASYLLGDMSATATSSINSILFPAGEQLYRGLYIQDDWKVSRKLTLNLGVRWELPGSWTERQNQLSYFEPGVVNPVLAAAGLNYPGTIGRVGSSTRKSPYNINLNWHEFSPRIGLAYQINSKTVVRTGYGIFFVPNNLNQGLMPTNDTLNAHSTPVLASINGGVTPYATFANPFPNGLVLPPGQNISLAQSVILGQTTASPLPTNPWAYAQQFNFNIQRELGYGFLLDTAFGGNKGTHLVIGSFPLDNLPSQDLSMGNALLASVPNPFYGLVQYGTLSAATVTAEQLLRPYPQYTGVALPSYNNGDSEYYSLQVKLQKRLSNGISILLGYTHAKIITDTETNTGWLESGGVASYQDPTNLKGERSISSFDVPNRLIVGYSADIPVGKGRKYLVPRVLDPVVGGWGVQGITTLQNGLPVHLTVTPNTSYTFGGTLRPNISANCNEGASGSTPEANLNAWFNTSCFSKPPAFTFGGEARNDGNIRGNGIANFDMSFFKNFPFSHHEGRLVQFRAEFFNLFNTPQFGQPGQVLGTAQFGVVSTQANNPRLVQLALRIKF